MATARSLGATVGTLLLATGACLGCSGGGRDSAPASAAPSPSARPPETAVPAPPVSTPAPRGEAAPAPPPASPSASARGPRSFAVYTLSRAKGVPPAAREALGKVRDLVEADRKRGVAVKMETTRLGLEGETRLCAEYEDAGEAAKALERARRLARGVELMNVVVEPCARSAPSPK